MKIEVPDPPARINSISAARYTEALHQLRQPSVAKLEEINAELAADKKRYEDFLATDYVRNGYRTPVPIEKIQEWVVQRDALQEQIRLRVIEKTPERDRLQKQIAIVDAEVKRVGHALGERAKKLSELRPERLRRVRFATELDSPPVLEEFIQKKAYEVGRYFERLHVSFPACDQIVANSTRIDVSTLPSFGAQLPSIKTLTALYGSLLAEFKAYTPAREFSSTFPALLQRAQIRNILEIGSGAQGIVGMLADSGVAKAAGVALHAIERVPCDRYGDDLRAKGVNFVRGDARDVLQFFPSGSIDLIVAAGVLSAGGQAHGSLSEILHQYPQMVEQCSSILNSVHPLFSMNASARMIVSSVSGVNCLFHDALTPYRIDFWRPSPRAALESENERINYGAPPIDQFRMTTAQGRALREWYRSNQSHYDYAQRLVEQSSDLTILRPY